MFLLISSSYYLVCMEKKEESYFQLDYMPKKYFFQLVINILKGQLLAFPCKFCTNLMALQFPVSVNRAFHRDITYLSATMTIR